MVIDLLLILAVLLILYLLAIMPRLRKKPLLKDLKQWKYAHRGLHDNHGVAPENSLAAFRLAVENGFGIEWDVQITKDEVPVIFHDWTLKRACGIDKKIAEMNYREVKEFCLFKSHEKIPTLQEGLELVAGKVPLIVELKIPLQADKTCIAVSKLLDSYQGKYCIESFNPLGVFWYRKNRNTIVRGQLATDFVKEKVEGSKLQYFFLKHLLFNFLTKPDFIAYQHTHKKDLSFLLCRKLFRITTAAWTITSYEEMEKSKDFFDIPIFEQFRP